VGHNNITESEIADKTAKKAATKKFDELWNITTHLDSKLQININPNQIYQQVYHLI